MTTEMGQSREPEYRGKRLGSSTDRWKLIDPAGDNEIRTLEQMLNRPGGSIKIPKVEIAALIIRLRLVEEELEKLKRD